LKKQRFRPGQAENNTLFLPARYVVWRFAAITELWMKFEEFMLGPLVIVDSPIVIPDFGSEVVHVPKSKVRCLTKLPADPHVIQQFASDSNMPGHLLGTFFF
jgi:hypothetical protein